MRRSTTKVPPKRRYVRRAKSFAQVPQPTAPASQGVTPSPYFLPQPALPLSKPEETSAGLQVPANPIKGESALGDVLTVRGQIPAGGFRWNPDLIATLKGWNQYEHMLRDDQVVACLALMSATITGRDWDWEIDDEDEQRPIANFLDEMLRHRMRGSLKQLFQYMFQAVIFGFAPIEKIWDTVLIDGKPYWGLIDFKLRPQWTFQVQIDHFGNMIGLRQLAYGKVLQLDPQKFIWFVNQPEIDPHYGRSMLIAAYEPWIDKLYLQRMWNIRLERTASGTIIGKQNLPLDPVQSSKLQTALKNMQSGGALVTPNGVEISVLQAQENHEMQIRVQELNKAIARSLLQPTDLGLSQTHASGSQARSRTQMDVYYHVTDAINTNMAEAFNEGVVDPLVLWNFGPDAEPPRLKFDTMTQSEKDQRATALAQLLQTGALIETDEDEAAIRLMVDLPDRDYSQEVTRAQPKPSGTGAAPGAGADGQGGEASPAPAAPPSAKPTRQPNKKDPIAPAKPVAPGKVGGIAPSVGYPNTSPAGGSMGTSISGDTGTRYDLPSNPLASAKRIVRTSAADPDGDGDTDVPGEADPDSWKDRMDVPGTLAVFSQLDKSFEQDLMDATNSMVDALKKEVRSKPGAKPPDADALTVPPEIKRRMNRTVKSQIQKTFKEGQRSAMSELHHAASRVKKFVGLFAVEDQDVADFINSLSFNITGDLSEQIQSTIRKTWLQAIASDLDTEDTIAAIDKAIAPLLAQEGDEGTVTSSRIGTIVRTNNTTAFNMARKKTFEDPSLNGFVEAYEFSAVMDDHTTDPCQWMDGKIYPVDSDVWQRFTPAVWYNCRSMQVPIVKGEDWEESEPPPDSLEPTFV